jgi:hypothetical protein
VLATNWNILVLLQPKGQNIKELETPLPWEINIKPSSKDKTIEHTIYLAVSIQQWLMIL